MWDEWMDAIPLCVEGCYEHNISEYKRAANYYSNHNMPNDAHYYEEKIIDERNKMEEEYNRPSKFKQIVNILFN